jgi:hypothetical protein
MATMVRKVTIVVKESKVTMITDVNMANESK